MNLGLRLALGAILSGVCFTFLPTGAGIAASIVSLVVCMYFHLAFLGGAELHPLDEWLALRMEKCQDPDMAIIDPHHHLWDPAHEPKGILSDLNRAGFLRPSTLQSLIVRFSRKELTTTFGTRTQFVGPYTLDQFRKDQGRLNIVKTVYIECGWHDKGVEEALKPVGEATKYDTVASAHPTGQPHGIVAHADLNLGAGVEVTLKALKAASPRMRGIRHSVAFVDDPDVLSVGKPEMSRDPKFREGFALLSKYDLSYDCWLYHTQIPELAELAEAFPETTIICDHVGTPLGVGKRKGKIFDEVFEEWKVSISQLAKFPNVVVKLSGLAMPMCGFGFDKRGIPASSQELADEWGPWFEHCIKEFGHDRCMFASNFPVDKVTCSYIALYNAFKTFCNEQKMTPQQKKMLFHDTAERVYRL